MLNSIIHNTFFWRRTLKSRIWETLNLSMCVEGSNNNKKTQKCAKKNYKKKIISCVRCYISCVTCHVSCVTCGVPPVTFHVWLLPRATATTLPLLTPPSYIRLVYKEMKTRKNFPRLQKSAQSTYHRLSRGLVVLTKILLKVLKLSSVWSWAMAWFGHENVL